MYLLFRYCIQALKDYDIAGGRPSTFLGSLWSDYDGHMLGTFDVCLDIELRMGNNADDFESKNYKRVQLYEDDVSYPAQCYIHHL